MRVRTLLLCLCFLPVARGIGLPARPRRPTAGDPAPRAGDPGLRGGGAPGDPGPVPADEDSRAAAIQRLSRVFRLDKVPVLRHHRSPPQYMLDLYRNVADSDGITKNRSPYGSNVVRGFPDRGESSALYPLNVSLISLFTNFVRPVFQRYFLNHLVFHNKTSSHY